MRLTGLIVIACTALLARAHAPLFAQIPSIETGTHVRITAATPKWTVLGRLDSVATDIVSLHEGLNLRHFAMADIARLEVCERHTRGPAAWKGAKIGFIVGAVIAVLPAIVLSVVAFEYSSPPPGELTFVWTRSALGTAAGGLAAGVIGATIGALIGTHHWREVYRRP